MVNVEITKKHIKNGERWSIRKNPVALAVKDALLEKEIICYDTYVLWKIDNRLWTYVNGNLWTYVNSHLLSAYLPTDAILWLQNFNQMDVYRDESRIKSLKFDLQFSPRLY